MRKVITAALLAALPVSSGGAQELPRFTSRSDLVVLHVNVKDRRGAYVTGLGREAFAILEDGRPQDVALFTTEDAPATIGLVIDSSGSMQPNRSQIIAAAEAFAAASHADDELFALLFNDAVTRALPPETPFTSVPDTLRAALASTIRTVGRTALFDGIAAALDQLERGRHERRVLVVVSDGGDNASRATFDEIMQRTQASNVVIYTVALVDRTIWDSDSNPGLLARIARTNGGEAFVPKTAAQIRDVLEHIARDIRHSYTLGYVPTNGERDGEWRQIRLTVRTPGRQRLVVRTRAGYLAGGPRMTGAADAR